METSNKKPSRLLPLDAMRGLIMVVMALDHANLFIAQEHTPGEYWGGAMPVYPNALSFLTRLVTHPAAPGFFFLMGVGMALFALSREKRGWSRWAVRRHFWIRGAVLMALQLLVINRAWELSPGGWEVETYIGVLFALGLNMILASFTLWLPVPALLALAAFLFVGTELLVPDPGLWGKLGVSNLDDYLNLILIRPGGTVVFWSNYPALPWLELVVFGAAFGRWLGQDSARTYRRGLVLGGVFLLLFTLLRSLNGFGNIQPPQGDTWIDFFNLVKYPPSMTFTLLTTGLTLILLWLLSKIQPVAEKALQPLAVFGRAPLFFYALHLFLYAVPGLLLPPGGTDIPLMLLYWIGGLVILYPLCLWYGRFKRSQPAGSILRFF
jgi:uncharacterized membrane protein